MVWKCDQVSYDMEASKLNRQGDIPLEYNQKYPGS